MREKPRPTTIGFAALLLLGLCARIAYVLFQREVDPTFAAPSLDGAYYVEWARALASGTEGPHGAYYLAPLYPFLLWGFFEVFGESWAVLFLVQQLATVVTAALMAACAHRLAGTGAGLASAGLLLAYHPVLYFASRPVGETVALMLLVAALFFVTRPECGCALGAGVLGGLATLARPNLLLVLVLWAGFEAYRRRWTRSALIVVGIAAVLIPVTLRNGLVSGHFVPISSNPGITLYHGNGPGARGIGKLPAGFSGRLSTQREEATQIAASRSGVQLDPVEADRWWGRQALRVRWDDPGDTVKLLLRRAVLVGANAELSLGAAPAIDANPWRHTVPLPFALILGLAIAALYMRGASKSGGPYVWGAIVACAAAPLLFYVSSRYRLPLATLLCLPAGVGLWGLFHFTDRRRLIGILLTLTVALGSLFAPVADVEQMTRCGALADRGAAWRRIGNLSLAERDLGQALAQGPGCAKAHFGLGLLLEDRNEIDSAESHYRQVAATDSLGADAAGNLGRLLVLTDRPQEAALELRRALQFHPTHKGCWTNLIGALLAAKDPIGALEAAERAIAAGVPIDPELLRDLQRAARPAK